MPVLGYKNSFKNLKAIQEETFIINFKLNYNESGALQIEDEKESLFDVGDYRILIEKVFDELDEQKFKDYDNGIFILSICKYIVDKVPNLYSITYESKKMVDTYYKQEILDAYKK